MRIKISSGAIRLVATSEIEKKMLRELQGRTFKASDYCTPHSKHAGTKSDGILDLYLDEVKE